MYGGTSIQGPYTVTWNSLALGMMVGDRGVPTFRHRMMARLNDNSDQKGRIILGGSYLGPQVRFMARCKEYKAGPIAAMWPMGAAGVSGQVGRDLYDMAQALVLTAVAGTPAATTPASRTCGKTILAPDFDCEITFGPDVREVPLEMLVMPTLVTSNDAFWVDA